MLRLMRYVLSIAAILFVSNTQSFAAPVNFIGSTSPANSLFAAGTPVVLSLDYTPAAGLVAAVNTATLTIGGQTWNTLLPGSTLSIVTNGAGNDDLSLGLSFGPSLGGLGTIAAAMNLTIFGTTDLGAAPDASQANVSLLAAFGNPGSGSLFLLGGPGIPGGGLFTNFGGTAVPEPGSIALLSGLGVVFFRRAWKKRNASTDNAA